MGGVAYQNPYEYLRYLQYAPQVSPAPAPTLPALDAPRTFAPPDVRTHTAGGCGCGSSHGGTTPQESSSESAPEGTTRPAFLSAALDTPAGFKPPAQITENPVEFLKGINWEADWWKFVAGALAYRLLAK